MQTAGLVQATLCRMQSCSSSSIKDCTLFHPRDPHWIQCATGLILLLAAGFTPPQLAAADDGDPVCFRKHDFDAMFSASTLHPDRQLASYLRNHKASQHYPTFQEVHRTLFHTDISIYHGFQPLAPVPFRGGVRPATIDFLRSKLTRPVQLMVEVGSFVGSSAAMFGKHLLQNVTEPHGLLLCIDTWDGDINMWLLESFVGKMGLQHGAPVLYERFLSRMVAEGLQDKVIPLRTSSTVGARLLAALRYQVDIVYLDSAHEVGETFFELNLFWDILPANGVLCGDDYHAFPAVKHDLDLFISAKKLSSRALQFSEDGRTWALTKLGSSQGHMRNGHIGMRHRQPNFGS